LIDVIREQPRKGSSMKETVGGKLGLLPIKRWGLIQTRGTLPAKMPRRKIPVWVSAEKEGL